MFSPRSKPQAQERAGSGPPVMSALRFRDARFEDATSAAARRLDCSDVDLFHLHHRIERALGGSGIGIGDRFGQSDRRDLPGQSPFVLAPAARTLFAAVAAQSPVGKSCSRPGPASFFASPTRANWGTSSSGKAEGAAFSPLQEFLHEAHDPADRRIVGSSRAERDRLTEGSAPRGW